MCLIKKFAFFPATEIEYYCYFLSESTTCESEIRPILYSSQPIRLQIFRTLAIKTIILFILN